MSRRRPLRLSTYKMHAELRVNPTCGCKARPLVKWDGHPWCSFPRRRKMAENKKILRKRVLNLGKMCAALFFKAILAEKKSSKMNLSMIIDPQLTDALLWRSALTAQS